MDNEVHLFDGFSARARKAVVLAQEYARMSGASEIDASFLLIGTLDTDRNGVMQDLLGVTTAEVSENLCSRPGDAAAAPARSLGFGDTAMQAFEYARREATDLHADIDSRHLLFGVLTALGEDETMLTSLHTRLASGRERVSTWLITGHRDTSRSYYPRQP